MKLGIFALAGRREGGPRGESGFAPEHLLLENDLHIGVFSGDFGQILRHRFAEGALVIEELDEGHGGVRVADEQNAAVPNKFSTGGMARYAQPTLHPLSLVRPLLQPFSTACTYRM